MLVWNPGGGIEWLEGIRKEATNEGVKAGEWLEPREWGYTLPGFVCSEVERGKERKSEERCLNYEFCCLE